MNFAIPSLLDDVVKHLYFLNYISIIMKLSQGNINLRFKDQQINSFLLFMIKL